jgi:cytochrome c7-like protein
MLQLLATVAVFAAPSEVIFPPQSLPVNFSHARHLAKKIDCDFCHDKAASSTKSSDNLLPSRDACETCHPPNKKNPDLSMGAELARVVMPAPNLKFDHAVHLKKGVACTRCHAGVDRVDLASRNQLPTMRLCLECHDSRKGGLHAPSRCATCHLMRPDGTLEQQLPTGTLMPSGVLRGDAHTLDFRTHHSSVAANDERYCANCHRQDFCLSCHNGVVKPLDFHGNDYISRHAIDARKDDPRCDGCHRRQSFCLGCHERLGVVDLRTGVDGAFVPIGQKRFHPLGWSDPSAMGQPNHHKWQAERNIKQCASCHRQDTCLECHATNASTAGGMGKMWVNPHPPDWRGSGRCQALADRNQRVCLRCHAAGDPLLSCR